MPTAYLCDERLFRKCNTWHSRGYTSSVQSTTIDDVLQEERGHLDQDTAEQDEEDLGEEATEEVGGIVNYLTELPPLSV